MRVLLASAPHADTFGYSMPPPGLLRLGGELERQGIAVALEDLAWRLAAGELAQDETLAGRSADVLLARGPHDVVGLSVMGATLPIALAIAERVRAAAPDVLILLGGPGTTGIDLVLLERFRQVDAIVRGEGERTLIELLERRRARLSFEGCSGLSWRSPDGRVRREADRKPIDDLAELAPYAWHLLPAVARYKEVTGEEEGLVALDSGRGCVFDCSFCTIGRFWGRRSRALPAARVADEIESLQRMPGARRAYLCHDIFGADRTQALELCRELIRRGNRVPWEVRARADHLDGELVDWMGRAGCYRVLIGLESADGALRNRHGKHMQADLDLLALVERLERAGITPILSCILGLPGEGEAELRATLELAGAASLRAGVNLSFHLVNPQPGCALGEQEGTRSRPVEGLAPDMALGAGSTAPERELIAAHPDLFGSFALLTALPGGEERLRELHGINQALPQLLMRFPRSFALLARRAGCDTLDLFRAWQACGLSFESWARAAREPLIDDCLRWEQALLRCAPRATRREGELQVLAEPLDTRFDLGRLRAALIERTRWPELAQDEFHFAVVRGTRGARTLRLSRDLARLLRELAEGRTPAELAPEFPGQEHALGELARAGLISLPTAQPAEATR